MILPALVGVPVVGALAVVVAGSRKSADNRRTLSLAGALLAVQAALSLVLLGRVADSGPVSTVLGGLPAAVGIELRADGLSALLVVLVALLAAGAFVYAATVGSRSPRFAGLYLLLVAGLTGVFVTADLFNLYVFLEIAGLAAYALVGLGDREAAKASLRYLVVGTVGATLYLLGVGYVYVATGTLNLADAATLLASGGYGGPALAAFALVFVGLGVKVPVVPLHTWLPDAHARAFVPVSVVLSALVTTAGTYALLRLLYGLFGANFLATVPTARTLVSSVGALGVLVGSALALRESKVKRVLAYSTVAQLGVVVVGVGVGTRVALAGAVVHLAGHAVAKAGLFLAAGAIAVETGATTVSEYAGIAQRAPVASGAFALAALSLVGVPPTVGFAGKWYVVVGALNAGAWAVAAVVLLGTLLSLGYLGRVLARLYFVSGEGDGSTGEASSPNLRPALAVALVAALASLALGLASATLVQFLEPTLDALLAR